MNDFKRIVGVQLTCVIDDISCCNYCWNKTLSELCIHKHI